MFDINLIKYITKSAKEICSKTSNADRMVEGRKDVCVWGGGDMLTTVYTVCVRGGGRCGGDGIITEIRCPFCCILV